MQKTFMLRISFFEKANARYITLKDSKAILINDNETEIIVVTLIVITSLKENGIDEIWIAFNLSVNRR